MSAPPTSSSSTAPPATNEPKPSYRRDLLVDIESRVQQRWEAAQIWETEAADAKTRKPEDKYLATFPYPYMNGVLHLGHAFTLSKVDFECQYQRLKGKNVLFPFGYHCTGMPICAAADRLKREVKQFGDPAHPEKTPNFPAPEPEKLIEAVTISEEKEEKKDDKDKKKGGKSKVAAKASKQNYQWQILAEMGVPENEIHKFQDARHWLSYFPPIATMDLKKFGLSADFRRSFITTDINPYYDSFVRWHFNTLRRREKIAFGGRLSIFSPIDNQTCADHDRSEGEGVGFTEYTLIKLGLIKPYPKTVVDALGEKYADRTVILPAATLRPETMFGQTNAWALPGGEYGIFEINEREVFICSPKSALNMAYQGLSPERGQVSQLGKINGDELLGCAVTAPHAAYEKLYILPLTTIKMDKGTAIVTSVPSDAPDDYAALMDLKNKQPFREKYGIKDEMVLPFEIVQIIETPGLGRQPAADLCVAQKVASQNDRQKLEDIKDKVYKEGFAKGIMLVGSHAGEKVSEAKPKIKAEMIAAGTACNYAEPDKKVVSRSGNECVCALSDQWYLKYGEPEWQEIVRKHVESTLETYNPQTKKDFLLTVDWLQYWAATRSYGLGTFLPWDPQYVIESLSDSTIYMAYYTIAHFLQGPNNGAATADNSSYLAGAKQGLSHIAASEMTDEVWNYIMLNKEFPEFPQTSIAKETVEKLRNAFEYWYPLDLRVSGKDLIGNHLTMSLYNHTAVWNNQPEMWPRSFFTNGHAQIDSQKMSKSTGNFITLRDACKEYSADATRFALADAGDGLEDANFERKSANAAILKLTKEEAWVREIVDWDGKNPATPLRTGELNFFDKVFLNELNVCIQNADQAYAKLTFRDALKYSWHQLQIERDAYKVALDAEKSLNKMHRDVLQRYFEVESILLSPICPHFSQHLWEVTGLANTNGRPEFVAKAAWPTVPADGVDMILSRQFNYLRDVNATLRRGLMESLIRFAKAPKPKAGEKPIVIEKWIVEIAQSAEAGILVPEQVTKLLTDCTLYIASEYPEWQVNVLKLIAQIWDELGRKADVLPDRKLVIPRLKSLPTAAGDKKALEASTKFANSVLEDLALRGATALELASPFSERDLIESHKEFVLRDLGISNVTIKSSTEGPSAPVMAAGQVMTPELMQVSIEALAANKALPGKPSPYFYKK